MVRDLDIYLAGEWTPGTGDEYREITSPGSGEHIATAPLSSRADLPHRIPEAVTDPIEEIARIQTMMIDRGKAT